MPQSRATALEAGAKAAAADVYSELRGCPYSLPDDAELKRHVELLTEAEGKLRAGIVEATALLRTTGHLGEIGGAQRAREVYESNAIEGVGMSLRETSELLVSDLGQQAAETVRRGMLVTSLVSDQKLVDVLGLNGAKILAEAMVEDFGRGRQLTEIDVRALHEMITAGESYAGRYKRYINSIAGSSHETPYPSDTPAAMASLIGWLQECKTMPATLIASIAHAWLTHIHPFEDGNGRVARVLVNLIMTRAGLPPVIVNHATDRARYIDALSVSDEAGDIMPLVAVFGTVQKRFIREVKKPRYLRALIRERIEQNTANEFRKWSKSLDEFLARLSGELATYRLSFRQVGSLDVNSFNLLRKRSSDGNTWIALVGRGEAEILLWMGFATPGIYGRIDSPVRYPSIYFSVRNPPFSPKPFRQLRGVGECRGLVEVTLLPDLSTRVYARFRHAGSGDVVRTGDVPDSAAEIAECLTEYSNERAVERAR